jgi:hypothetical protein
MISTTNSQVRKRYVCRLSWLLDRTLVVRTRLRGKLRVPCSLPRCSPPLPCRTISISPPNTSISLCHYDIASDAGPSLSRHQFGGRGRRTLPAHGPWQTSPPLTSSLPTLPPIYFTLVARSPAHAMGAQPAGACRELLLARGALAHQRHGALVSGLPP